jgi:hypothetical protein
MEAMRHDHGSVLPDEIRRKLHATELDYFKQYDALLTEYMAAIDIDLTSVRNRSFPVCWSHLLASIPTSRDS